MLVLLILGLVSYAFASAFLAISFIGKSKTFSSASKLFSLCGFGILSIILYKLATPLLEVGVVASRDVYLFGFSWIFVLATLLIWYKIKNSIVFLLSSPLLFVLLHTAMLAQDSENLTYVPLEGLLFILHLACIFTALISLFAGGLSSILFLIKEKAMKMKKKETNFLSHVPSLESLDKVNYLATMIGFPFYVIGLVCGFIWAGITWGDSFSGDIKEIISILVCICYAFLFHMRMGLELRGKKPALLILLICCISLFSLFGINILFETHHKF